MGKDIFGNEADDIKGLLQYVHLKRYRQALGLPDEISEKYSILAQGEYNRNYYFIHPVSGEKLILRVNLGSQMGIKDQIGYEYNALKLLENSKRTPKALYVDGSFKNLNYGIMVMEFLPGKVLDYKTDMKKAAACFADIHSVKIPENSKLIMPENLTGAILDECSRMLEVYISSDVADSKKKDLISEIFKKGKEKLSGIKSMPFYRCCINTELNSTNFLINENGKDYLIDWEKPLYGDPAQDLGHFLAPTTTFWKTDIILDSYEVEEFIKYYTALVGNRFNTGDIRERVYTYIPINCLRGITWCAMAWVQYRLAQKGLFNASTAAKLDEYLDENFLNMIKDKYIDNIP